MMIKKVNILSSKLLILMILLILSIVDQPVFSQTTNNTDKIELKRQNKRKYCSPDTIENLPKLIDELMIDLPNYTNRVIQRSRKLKRQVDSFSYILIAGKPDLSPLPLNPGISNTENEPTDVKQVFFTTLERKYSNYTSKDISKPKSIELQQFHRLFLTKSKTGWELVMMFSQTGGYPSKMESLTPMRDSSNSAIAQGVKLWLRDCQSRKELTIDN